jgi:hypothetical protein
VHRYPICEPPFLNCFIHHFCGTFSLKIIVEQLQTLPKTQSEINISPFLKTLDPLLYYINRIEGFVFLEMGLYRSRIEFLVMFEVVQHCL